MFVGRVTAVARASSVFGRGEAADFLRMCQKQQAQARNRFRYPGHFDRDGVSTKERVHCKYTWLWLSIAVGLSRYALASKRA
jgi:hypothetical protein